jgi:hypothetical protein
MLNPLSSLHEPRNHPHPHPLRQWLSDCSSPVTVSLGLFWCGHLLSPPAHLWTWKHLLVPEYYLFILFFNPIPLHKYVYHILHWQTVGGCIQKFLEWPPGMRTANCTALFHYVRLYSLNPETFWYTLIVSDCATRMHHSRREKEFHFYSRSETGIVSATSEMLYKYKLQGIQINSTMANILFNTAPSCVCITILFWLFLIQYEVITI